MSPWAFRGAVTGMIVGGFAEVLFVAPVAPGEHVVQIVVGLVLAVLFGLLGTRMGLRVDAARHEQQRLMLDTQPTPSWDTVTRSIEHGRHRWPS